VLKNDEDLYYPVREQCSKKQQNEKNGSPDGLWTVSRKAKKNTALFIHHRVLHKTFEFSHIT
jgi:hypothetical protein